LNNGDILLCRSHTPVKLLDVRNATQTRVPWGSMWKQSMAPISMPTRSTRETRAMATKMETVTIATTEDHPLTTVMLG